MEIYGHDPAGQWISPGHDTGLEEPMMKLRFRDGDSYPERPNEANCIYYLRTGFCGYGSRCRFNHPPDRNSVVGAGRPGGEEYPERVGQPVCKFYMRTGTCKFGTSCKYHHPRHGVGSASPVLVNYVGYPLRPGEEECSYYMRTGECKFGVSCKFHHPDLAGIQESFPPSALYSNTPSSSGPSSQQYGVIPGSYVQGSFSHHVMLSPGGLVSVPGWSAYQTPLSPVAPRSTQPSAGASPYYGVTQMYPSVPAYTGPYTHVPAAINPLVTSKNEHMFPERPGQPECQFYMKTGDCRFGSSCRYNHPPEWNALKTDCAFSPTGLPLRPGVPVCAYFSQHGICKFGRTCKFDHSLGNMSYTPSPSQCSLAVSKDSLSTRIMSFSTSASSASVGSILLKSTSVPNSHIQSTSS